MRLALRIAALIVVAALLHFFIRSQIAAEPTMAEESAYREWAMKKAEVHADGWDEYHGISDLRDNRNYDLEPYADPTLYAPGSDVLMPGDVYRGEVIVTLPGGSENNGTSAVGDYQRDPRVRVVRNEWENWGVEVSVDDVWVENGLMGVRPVVHATIAGDHRATDGRTGGEFLGIVNELLQEPEKLWA